MADLKFGRTVYTVTPTNDTYVLGGVRGAAYRLMRNVRDPSMLFAINDASFLKGTPFDGRWFTDRDGTLRLL